MSSLSSLKSLFFSFFPVDISCYTSEHHSPVVSCDKLSWQTTRWAPATSTQWLLTVTHSCCIPPHPHHDFQRSRTRVAYHHIHTVIADGHTLVLYTTTSTQWLPTVTHSCYIPPGVASNVHWKKIWRALISIFGTSNEHTRTPPPQKKKKKEMNGSFGNGCW